MKSRRYAIDARWVVAAGALTIALLAAVVFLASELSSRRRGGSINLQQALADPEVRQRVVDELVQGGGGLWDAHPDPDVGYTLLPSAVRSQQRVEVRTNSLGLREKEYQLPKPSGLTRIVLLGDSYVFATGLRAEDRMGVILEEYLREGQRQETGADAAEVEVLHIGVASWNIISECAYLRRQLSLLQPDLVVQITVPNDLDDVYGVRGFGTLATFSGQQRHRADSLIQYSHPDKAFGFDGINHLNHALEFESASRFEAAAAAILRLSSEVERRGARYMILVRWPRLLDLVRDRLVPGLEPRQIAYLASRFPTDEQFWVSPRNPHWNRAGMEKIARLLYALILERELLPALALKPWAQADAVKEKLHGAGLAESLEPGKVAGTLERWPVDAKVDLDPLSQEDAAHFMGGVDSEGLVSPYASITLRSQSGRTLRLQGAGLDRPEMDGAAVSVFVDELPLGTFEVEAGLAIDESWPLPDEARGREFVAVRISSNDYVYAGPTLRHCVVFRLTRLEIE